MGAGRRDDRATERHARAECRNGIAALPIDNHILDPLSSIDTPGGTLDLESFQLLMQRVIGNTIVAVSGEITGRNDADHDVHRLRPRQTSGRQAPIDVEVSDGPDDLFDIAVLTLLERVDPEIAAGIYVRDLGDAATAVRLIAVTLADRPSTEKYPLNLKSDIRASRRKLDAACVGPRSRDRFAVRLPLQFAVKRPLTAEKI